MSRRPSVGDEPDLAYAPASALHPTASALDDSHDSDNSERWADSRKHSKSTSCGFSINAHLPHEHSRLFFLLLLACALIALAFWLQFTIHSKWIEAQRAPEVRLSVQRMALLPPIQNLVFSWLNLFFNAAPGGYEFTRFPPPYSPALSASSAPYREIVPFFQTPTRLIDAASLRSLFSCEDAFFFQANTLCAAPGFASPSTDMAFRTVSDVLLVNFHVFLNTTFLRDPLSGEVAAPYISSSIGISPILAQRVVDLSPIGNSSAHDECWAEALEISLRVPGLRYYTLNNLYSVNVQQNLLRTLGGGEVWTQDLQSADIVPLRKFQVDQSFESLLDSHASDPARIALLKEYRADPALEYMCLSLAFRMYSFDIRVEEEIWSYGFFAFLADLGGVLNIGALVFALAFPLWKAATKPRIFLGLLAWQAALKCRGIDDEAEEGKRKRDDVADGAGSRRGSLLVHGAQRRGSDSYRMRELSVSRGTRGEREESRPHSYEPPQFQPGPAASAGLERERART